MRLSITLLCLVALAASASPPIEKSRTSYVPLGSDSDEALLYEPIDPTANARIALAYVHPSGNVFNMIVGAQMASRGYRVLMINHHGEDADEELFAPAISRGIAYLRSLPGVRKVVLIGHSGGGHLVGWYQNIAENGSRACRGPEKIYPCTSAGLDNLANPDGIVFLDATLGAFHQMSSVDPAVDGAQRKPSLDMFAAANGYDVAAKRATYSADFAKRFYAAQAARNTSIVAQAVARWRAIQQRNGQFRDDEPLTIPGMAEGGFGADQAGDTAGLPRTPSSLTSCLRPMARSRKSSFVRCVRRRARKRPIRSARCT